MRSSAKVLKLPHGYLSWTQLFLWENNREKYKQSYFENKKDESVAPKREWGKKFAENRERNQSCNEPEAELARIFFPSVKGKEVELSCWLDLNSKEKIKIFGKPDGFDRKTMTLIEDKSGSNWTQGMVDKHGQLTFYSLIIWLKYKKLPARIFLNFIPTIEDEFGDVRVSNKKKQRTFKTIRTLPDIFLMVNRISKAAKEINQEYLKYLKSLKNK